LGIIRRNYLIKDLRGKEVLLRFYKIILIILNISDFFRVFDIESAKNVIFDEFFHVNEHFTHVSEKFVLKGFLGTNQQPFQTKISSALSSIFSYFPSEMSIFFFHLPQ